MGVVDLEWLPKGRERGMIDGRQAASFAEYRVALALWFLRLEFRYKYTVLNTIYIIDFYIFNGIEWVPLEVRNYTGCPETSQDRLRIRIIEGTLSRKLNIIYDTQVQSFEMALDAIRSIL